MKTNIFPDNQADLNSISVDYKNFKFEISGDRCGEFNKIVADIDRPLIEHDGKYESIVKFAIKHLRGVDNGLNDINQDEMSLNEQLYVAAAVYVLQGYGYISNGVSFDEAD